MSELSANRLWDVGPKDRASQFARMILGGSVARSSRFAPSSIPASTRSVGTSDAATEHAPPRPAARPHLAQPAALSKFTVGQLVVADLLVLLFVCSALSVLSPAWGMPWASLPIFVVLVTLFGF